MIKDQLTAAGSCRRALAWFRRPRRVESTPSAWALVAPTVERIAEIEQLAAERHAALRVLVDPHFVPGECTWCAPARPELATVRIFGNPSPAFQDAPLRTVEVCHCCAVNPRTGAVRQALIEAEQHRLVVVEVCES
jgi:hypothetical protein